MRHRLSNNKLSRPSSQRKALLRNLVSDAIMYGRIKTTKAKAKEARPILEKMITLSKTKDFNSIRKVSEFITDKSVVDHLFENVAEKFLERNGGYSRIVSIGNSSSGIKETACFGITHLGICYEDWNGDPWAD